MYKLSPSKAHRFLYCTKSLEYDGEFIDTPATIRGKILHKYAEMKINFEDCQEFCNENQINDYEEYLINGYVSAVWNEYNFIGARNINVEVKKEMMIYWFNINYIIDVLIIAGTVASIIDLKTGNGDVDADENEQLLMYAYDVLIKYPKIKQLRLSIFQKGKLKTTVMTRDEVMEFFFNKYNVFEQIYNNDLQFNPGEKQCHFCNAKDKCIARAKWIVRGKDYDEV